MSDIQEMTQGNDQIDDQLDDDADDDVVYNVNTFGSDFLVDGLIRRLDSGDIYTPGFQRNFVWSVTQSSRFIESILLGLPVPGIFLYREDGSRKHLIIDGLQRLSTISGYAKGIFPGTGNGFRLTGIKSKFLDKPLADLDPEDKRRFYDTVLHATIIQQLTPENDSSSAYYIFERLNTGGTPLEPEEIRAALYHGEFQEYLTSLNDRIVWRGVFGVKHKRSKDIEVILRFFAFRFRRDSYRAPMKIFLNKFMAHNRKLDKYTAESLDREFLTALHFVVENLPTRPFRPVRSFNVAAFDSIMVTVSENFELIASRRAEFVARYNSLVADKKYLELITRRTASEQNVKDRFAKAHEYLVGQDDIESSISSR